MTHDAPNPVALPQQRSRQGVDEPCAIAPAAPAADVREEAVELRARQRPHELRRLVGREGEGPVHLEEADKRLEVRTARVVDLLEQAGKLGIGQGGSCNHSDEW